MENMLKKGKRLHKDEGNGEMKIEEEENLIKKVLEKGVGDEGKLKKYWEAVHKGEGKEEKKIQKEKKDKIS